MVRRLALTASTVDRLNIEQRRLPLCLKLAAGLAGPQHPFGLPVTAALLIAGVLIVLVAAAAFLVPGARRRAEARGNGTYGPPR